VPDGAIVFDHVWKKFRRGERHDSLRDLIPSLVRRAVRPPAVDALDGQEFWAVRDVSFEVKPGQALGIIGPNGAGKSTALKLLTRILKPSRGHCHVRGRAGALIEVAAGFHPDLTGRENVFLQGAILGMRQAEVLRRFDAIVDFAGVSEFIDTPVKRYSSGMNARLGFAIAVNLDPDSLIIDEVLSVGDMGFQERCIQKMREFKKNGVAIVFVSHNLQAVAELCDSAVYLSRSVVASGPTADVIDAYIKSQSPSHGRPPFGDASISGVRLTTPDGVPVDQARAGDPLVLSLDYSVVPSLDDLTFSIGLYRSLDSALVYSGEFSPAELGVELATAPRDENGRAVFTVDYRLQANVARGQYHFGCAIGRNATGRLLDRILPASPLVVHEYRTAAGVAYLGVEPTVRALSAGLSH